MTQTLGMIAVAPYWLMSVNVILVLVAALAIVRSLLSHPGTDPNAVDDNGINIFVGFRTMNPSVAGVPLAPR